MKSFINFTRGVSSPSCFISDVSRSFKLNLWKVRKTWVKRRIITLSPCVSFSLVFSLLLKYIIYLVCLCDSTPLSIIKSVFWPLFYFPLLSHLVLEINFPNSFNKEICVQQTLNPSKVQNKSFTLDKMPTMCLCESGLRHLGLIKEMSSHRRSDWVLPYHLHFIMLFVFLMAEITGRYHRGPMVLVLYFFPLPVSLEQIWESRWFILVAADVIFPCTICCQHRDWQTCTQIL